MIGTQLRHYRILAPLGAGGMGEVYRARDERLDREVALKLLPAEALADEDRRRRFHREAVALSRLSHPGIATIHAFETHRGVDFIVMEAVQGQKRGINMKRRPTSSRRSLERLERIS